MRMFVAVEISDRLRQAAAAAATRIRQDVGRALEARWVDPVNMHLTVRFIGQVDDDRAPDLVKVLAEPVRVAPFEIALGRCGVFPARGGPRVVWLGLTTGLPSLAAMRDEFSRRLALLGIEPEDRPYSAHLTLARVKDLRKEGRGSPAAVREAIEKVDVAPARCRVDRATIFRSHMSSAGSWYEPLAYAATGTEAGS